MKIRKPEPTLSARRSLSAVNHWSLVYSMNVVGKHLGLGEFLPLSCTRKRFPGTVK